MATCKDCLCVDVCSIADVMGEDYCCEGIKDRSKFIELPCKVGDMVYVLPYEYLKVIEEKEIGCIHITGSSDFSIAFYEDTYGGCFGTAANIGKTVFLTRKEAERALNGTEKSDS